MFIEKVKAELQKDLDGLRQSILEQQLVINIHEDRMVRLVDDQKIYENSRDLLRSDIRAFERLCQDLSQHNSQANQEMSNYMKNSMSELQYEIDCLKENYVEQKIIIDT